MAISRSSVGKQITRPPQKKKKKRRTKKQRARRP